MIIGTDHNDQDGKRRTATGGVGEAVAAESHDGSAVITPSTSDIRLGGVVYRGAIGRIRASTTPSARIPALTASATAMIITTSSEKPSTRAEPE